MLRNIFLQAVAVIWLVSSLVPLIMLGIDALTNTIMSATHSSNDAANPADLDVSDIIYAVTQTYEAITQRLPELAVGIGISVAASLLAVVIAGLAGFALRSMKRRLSDKIILFTVLATALPSLALIIGYETILTQLGLWHRYDIVVLVLAAVIVPVATWMMRGAFLTVPKVIYESATVDGCSPLTTLVKLVVPATRDRIFSILVLVFLITYSNYTLPSFMLTQDQMPITALVGSSLLFTSSSIESAELTTLIAAMPGILTIVLFYRRIIDAVICGFGGPSIRGKH